MSRRGSEAAGQVGAELRSLLVVERILYQENFIHKTWSGCSKAFNH